MPISSAEIDSTTYCCHTKTHVKPTKRSYHCLFASESPQRAMFRLTHADGQIGCHQVRPLLLVVGVGETVN